MWKNVYTVLYSQFFERRSEKQKVSELLQIPLPTICFK